MADSALDMITKFVPGFGSYRSEQRRRDDDVAVRKYLADRLQECKRDLQVFMSPMVETGNFQAITQGEKLRSAMELAQTKIRASVEGYSSWFEATRVDEAKLKQVVDLDNDLVAVIDRLQHELSKLDPAVPKFDEASAVISNFKERFARRKDLLAG
jgi:hypothetical protein